ncbi:MAG: rubrerythrin family protein [Chloroflexi bacterium]|nr:rubrerythrin family protein [Chloroflexota bacterium]
MRPMTESNLSAAFAGESQAHMRYLIFADKAEAEGKSNIARLYRAIAHAERVHATNHFVELQRLGGTVANLEEGIKGETFEVDEMYPAYFEVAKLQKERGALRSITYALRAEEIHAKLYAEAKAAATAGSDYQMGAVYICETCGHTVIGSAPDVCPICGKPHTSFRKF